jgi:hypothetical protein
MGARWLVTLLGPAVISSLLTWALQDYAPAMLGQHAWSFFYSFLPLWVGLVVFGLWWLIRDYHRLRRYVLYNDPNFDEGDFTTLEAKLRSRVSWYIRNRPGS